VSSPNGTIGDHPLDDLAAYALDALEDVERRAVDHHLTGCLDCRAELDGHYETLAVLAPDEAPPAAVWERIAVAIDNQPDEEDVRPAAEVRVLRPSRRPWLVAAAGLVAAGIIGGVLGYSLGNAGDDGADITSLAQQAEEAPDGVVATLADTAGQPLARVVADDDGAYIVLDGLENLPEGRAYQLWSLTPAQPVSLGMLGREGTNTVAFRLPPTITELAITEAPTSGDAAPGGDFLASGSISGTVDAA
jgi:hypothetical protein